MPRASIGTIFRTEKVLRKAIEGTFRTEKVPSKTIDEGFRTEKDRCFGSSRFGCSGLEAISWIGAAVWREVPLSIGQCSILPEERVFRRGVANVHIRRIDHRSTAVK